MGHRSVYFSAGLPLALSWWSLVLVDPSPPGSDTVRIGYFLGSLFAHATLAAAWTALGPGPLAYRVPLSILWVGSLPVAVGINIAINGGPHSGALTVGGCLVGQWLLLLLPLAGLARGLGVQLRRIGEEGAGEESERFHFEIRHLLAIMAIVSVLLGAGRAIAPLLSLSTGEAPVFVFLAVAAVIVTVPLLLAGLMRRLAPIGVLASLALIAAATLVELPLLKALGGAGPQRHHFIAINVASAIVILVVTAILRINGYCLTRGSMSASGARSNTSSLPGASA